MLFIISDLHVTLNIIIEPSMVLLCIHVFIRIRKFFNLSK